MKTDIEADLFLVAESDGGRRSPFLSGYRPQFRFDGRDNDCNITLVDREQLGDGETGRIALTFLRPELQTGRLSVGAEFCIAEGARVVGQGKITAILDETMINKPNG